VRAHSHGGRRVSKRRQPLQAAVQETSSSVAGAVEFDSRVRAIAGKKRHQFGEHMLRLGSCRGRPNREVQNSVTRGDDRRNRIHIRDRRKVESDDGTATLFHAGPGLLMGNHQAMGL